MFGQGCPRDTNANTWDGLSFPGLLASHQVWRKRPVLLTACMFILASVVRFFWASSVSSQVAHLCLLTSKHHTPLKGQKLLPIPDKTQSICTTRMTAQGFFTAGNLAVVYCGVSCVGYCLDWFPNTFPALKNFTFTSLLHLCNWLTLIAFFLYVSFLSIIFARAPCSTFRAMVLTWDIANWLCTCFKAHQGAHKQAWQAQHIKQILKALAAVYDQPHITNLPIFLPGNFKAQTQNIC